MEFLYLFLACAFFALQFIFSKLFESRTLGNFSVCFWNQVVTSIIAIVFLMVKGQALPDSVPTEVVLIAALYCASMLIGSIASIFALKLGYVSTIGTYCLAGGMLLPFVYGIFFLGESATVAKWIGMLVLCLSLVPPMVEQKKNSASAEEKHGTSFKYVFLCILVFVANGLVSIASKMHQISPVAISEDAFILLSNFMRIGFSLIMMVIIAVKLSASGDKNGFRKTFWDIGTKPMTGLLFFILVLSVGAYAICNTIGNLFSLTCMKTMDASLQFPLLSATVIVLIAIFGRIFFKEKISKATAVSLLLSVAGIVIFML